MSSFHGSISNHYALIIAAPSVRSIVVPTQQLQTILIRIIRNLMHAFHFDLYAKAIRFHNLEAAITWKLNRELLVDAYSFLI